MSAASKQALAILAIVDGIFITIRDYQLEPELLATVLYGEKVCSSAIMAYPETGDTEKNLLWITEKVSKIETVWGGCDDLYTFGVLLAMASHLIVDLMGVVQDGYKLSLLLPVFEVVEGLYGLADANRDNYPAYEMADTLLSAFYADIGFVL